MSEEMDTGGRNEGETTVLAHPCGQCAAPIANGDEKVDCFGKCRLSMHTRCLPRATAVGIKMLSQMPNAVFVCDACLASHKFDDGNTEKILQVIDAKFNNLAGVIDFVKNFDSAVKKIVREELVRANGKKTVVAEKTEESRKIFTRSAAKAAASANKRKAEEEVEETGASFSTPKTSFAEVVRKRVKISEEEVKKKQSKKPDPVVVIRPKEGVQVEDVRAEVQKKVNAKDLNVHRVTSSRSGAVIVSLKDEASVAVLQANVEKQLGGRFEAQLRESFKPSIKIIGMSDEMDEDELRDSLVEQNDVFANLKHFKLRKTFHIEKWRFNNIGVFVELDAETFFKVLDLGKVNCGWNRCRVFDGLQVTRCFKCNGYGHKGADCRSEKQICPICSEDHKWEECKATAEKCVNCEKLRVQRKVNVDANHSAWSSDCPVFQKEQEKRNRLVDFTT